MREQLMNRGRTRCTALQRNQDAIDPIIQRQLAALHQQQQRRGGRQHLGQRGQVVAGVDRHPLARNLRGQAADSTFIDQRSSQSDSQHRAGKGAVVDGCL